MAGGEQGQFAGHLFVYFYFPDGARTSNLVFLPIFIEETPDAALRLTIYLRQVVKGRKLVL